MNPIKERLKDYKNYKEMADIMGMHENSIRNLAKMSSKQLLGIKVETAINLLDKLDIAILKNIKDYELIKK